MHPCKEVCVDFPTLAGLTKIALSPPNMQTGDQGELHGRACVRKNRIEGRVSVHSSTPLFLPKSKHTHNNNNNKLPKDWLIA